MFFKNNRRFKMLICVLFLTFLVNMINAVIYDAYSGKIATKARLKLYEERNNTHYCTLDVKPCDPNEWKRVDGTCNNLNYPSKGGYPTANIRLLPHHFSVDFEPRKSKSGKDLPLPRHLRTELLRAGYASQMDLTQLVPYFLQFSIDDIYSFSEVSDYVFNTTNCCKPEGKSNYACTPIKMPVDDPVHRFSGLSCQSQTRPHTFQYFGCAEHGTPYARIMIVTPVYDLTLVYGLNKDSINRLRTFKNGLLKFDKETFKKTKRQFPPGDHSEAYNRKTCLQNDYPRETLCYKDIGTTTVGVHIFILMFYRLHNCIATELRRLNPCWDDDRLFNTARDINIAISIQILYYEVLPIFHGKENLIKEGILSRSKGFRDLYDPSVLPEVTDEFTYSYRWYHTIQSTKLPLHDRHGHYLKTFPTVNATFREGFLAVDDIEAKVLAGSYRHYASKFDRTIDYDMADRAFGAALLHLDVATGDLAKGRLLGFSPYVKYRDFCTKRSHKNWDDLKGVINEERLYLLKQLYENVEDMDLLSGLWVENKVEGGIVPSTLHCLAIDQLRRSIVSDRHWYERPNRPHAFTAEQLQAIRKVTLGRLLCCTGDGVTKVQPNAFYSIDKKKNSLTDCSSPKIGKLDLSHWKDSTC